MKTLDFSNTQLVDEGTIKLYDRTIGKGLISRKGNSDVHVNHAALKDDSVQDIKPGDRVRFQVIEGPKGWFASAVLKIHSAE